MKKMLVLLVIPVLLFSAISEIALAQGKNRPQKNVTLAADEIIDHDYFAAGDNVTLSGTVNGDAYIAGGNITIDGTVNGDLLVAGGQVYIRGTIAQNVRAVGGQLNISGATIGRNLTLVGGNLDLSSDATINGSLTSAGGNINIYSPIGKEVNIAGGQVVLGSTVGGQVNAAVGQINLKKDTVINGDLNYWSGEKAVIEDGARVTGETSMREIQTETNAPSPRDAASFFTGLSIFGKILGFLTYLILGLIITALFPRLTQSTVNAISEKPGISFLVGFLIMILFPVLFIVLLITVIGIPLAFLLLFIYIICLFFAVIKSSIWLGQKVIKSDAKNPRFLTALIIGLLIYEVITFIPFVGWLAKWIIVTIGLGAAILGDRNYYLGLKKKDII